MQCVSIQNVCISRFAIRIPPIRIRSTSIPPRNHVMRIHSMPYPSGVHQQESQTYPPTQIPPIRIFNTYPTSADPFKSIQKVCNQQEWQGVWVSLHIISYRSYLTGIEQRNLGFRSISLQNYKFYRVRMNMKLQAIGLQCFQSERAKLLNFHQKFAFLYSFARSTLQFWTIDTTFFPRGLTVRN